jgi:hypothetical protein
MNVIYNSENYYVVQYLGQHMYELVDKRSKRGAFFHGDAASSFMSSMRTAVAEAASLENVDEFLDGYEELLNVRVVPH